jgi:undecaprenyl-phosphate 4-deoxy-4-formamido-L-arabinose transferase
MQTPDLSVIIPVYNEEEGLPALFARLYPALDALGIPYEIVFINDGSRDRSAGLLREQFQKRPTSRRSSCSTATSASTWPSWPASSIAGEGAW